MRFALVAVVCRRKHVVNMYDDHPMRSPEKSRRQKKAGSSLRDFHESPWRVSRSSFHHPRGESGSPKTPFTMLTKAPSSLPGKPREGGSKNKGRSTSRGILRKKAHDTPSHG